MNNLILSNLSQLEKSNLTKVKADKFSFITQTLNNKIIAIYDTNMYPLLTAKKNEYFELNENYIFKYNLDSLIAVYDSKTNKIFEVEKNQTAKHITGYSVIAIYQDNQKTKLYSCSCQKVFFESLYTDSIIELTKDFILELVDNKIKAIYCNDTLDPINYLKSDFGYFEILETYIINSDYYIRENEPDNQGSKLYLLTKKNFSNCYDVFKIHNSLKLKLSVFESKFSTIRHKNILLILGKYNGKIKEISLYDEKKEEIISTKNFKISDDRYFDIYTKKDYLLVKIMQDDKCIELLDSKFEIIISTIYNKDSIPSSYFELEYTNQDLYIKKFFGCNCNTIYLLNSPRHKDYKEFIKIQDKNVNLVICKGQYSTIYILYTKNDKCIYIKAPDGRMLTGLEYEVYKDSGDKLIAIYGIRDGKRVAIYDYDLREIVDISDTHYSLQIQETHLTLIEEDEDTMYSLPTPIQKMLYLKCDELNNIVEIVNEKNEPLLKFEEDVYYKIVHDRYILKYKNSKCTSIYSFSGYELSYKKLDISNEENFFELCYKNNKPLSLFKEYNAKSGQYSLYDKSFRKIANSYLEFCIWNDFLLLQTSSTSLQILDKHSYKVYNILDSNYGGTLKIGLETNSANSFMPIYELSDEKIVTVYIIQIISHDEFFTKEILSNINGIEVECYDNKFTFFKSDDKLYNVFGNEINSLNVHLEN